MPQATGPGFQCVAKGTSTCSGVKGTNRSPSSAPTCTATKTTVSPPGNDGGH